MRPCGGRVFQTGTKPRGGGLSPKSQGIPGQAVRAHAVRLQACHRLLLTLFGPRGAHILLSNQIKVNKLGKLHFSLKKNRLAGETPLCSFGDSPDYYFLKSTLLCSETGYRSQPRRNYTSTHSNFQQKKTGG